MALCIPQYFWGPWEKLPFSQNCLYKELNEWCLKSAILIFSVDFQLCTDLSLFNFFFFLPLTALCMVWLLLFVRTSLKTSVLLGSWELSRWSKCPASLSYIKIEISCIKIANWMSFFCTLYIYKVRGPS